MNLPSSPETFPSEVDLFSYSRWQDILRSWFWRYYDHLLKLTLYNFGWFLTCFGVGWLASLSVILGTPKQWNWLSIYIIYVLESAVSVIWALAIFKIIAEDTISLEDLIIGLRRYFWKALTSASLLGLVFALALYNIKFYFTLQVSSHIWIFILIGFVATVFLYGLMMTFYQWPLLFFQDPPFAKLFYRSFLITLGTGPNSFLLLLFSALAFFLFFLAPYLWFLTGFAFLFSLYTVALEKHLLRYKIIYQNKPIAEYLESVDRERKRGWRDIFKPWETR